MTNFNQKGMLDDSIYKEAGDLLAVGGWMIEMPKDGFSSPHVRQSSDACDIRGAGGSFSGGAL